MTVRAAAAAFAIAAALAGCSRAAEPPPPVLRVLAVQPVATAGGGEALARVQVEVKPGYHVQANPVLDDALIPITLTLEPEEAVQPGPVRYPAPSRMRLRGADEDLVVLDGRFTIEVPLRVLRHAAPGARVLAGTLRYQACDDERCLFPRTVPVAIPVEVAAAR